MQAGHNSCIYGGNVALEVTLRLVLYPSAFTGHSEVGYAFSTLTCLARPSGCLLRLCGAVAILVPPFPAGGAGRADVDLADLKERHHERLLLQRAVSSHESRVFTADGLPCLGETGNS